jgi:superfamily II DNA/RNA helicase
MSFKKIPEALSENLERNEIVEPNEFQTKILSKIKSGAHIYGIGPKGCGKTMALMISVLTKLKSKAQGDNPRALIFVKDKVAAETLEAGFKKLTRFTDLRVVLAIEEHTLAKQKDQIYLGSDVVIATPKRLSKLYFLNGINLTQLQMMIVEDAEFTIKNNFHTTIDRISESLPKTQFLMFFKEKHNRFDDLFMERAITVSIDK